MSIFNKQRLPHSLTDEHGLPSIQWTGDHTANIYFAGKTYANVAVESDPNQGGWYGAVIEVDGTEYLVSFFDF